MIGKELLEKKPVTLSHVKHVLESRDMTGKEPTFEQTQTLEYTAKFARLTNDKAESLYNNLLNMEGVNEELAVKLVDFLPEDEEAVKILLPRANALSDSQIGEVLTLVKKYAPGS